MAAWATVSTDWFRQRKARQPNVSAGFLDLRVLGRQGIEFVNMGPGLAIQLGYLLFSDGLGEGQSFGKKLVKIAVVDRSTGAPCTYGGSLLRNLVRMLGVFDWAFALGERRQRLGDKAANTIVVKLRG